MKIPSISLAPLAHVLRKIGRAGPYTVTRHDSPSRPGPAPAHFGEKVRGWFGRIQSRADAPALAKAHDSVTRVSDKLLQLSSEGIRSDAQRPVSRRIFRALDQLSKAGTALERKGGDAAAHLRSGLADRLRPLDAQQLARMADTWNAVEDCQLQDHAAVFVAALRSAIWDAQRLRADMDEAAALRSALAQAEPAIAALFRESIEGRQEGRCAFDAMAREIELCADISGSRAQRAVFDVIEQWVSQNKVTQAELHGFTRRLSAEMLETVSRPGELGGGPGRVMVDHVLKEVLGEFLRHADLPHLVDSDLGAVAVALRTLKAPDPTFKLARELALRKDRAAEPFREAMSHVLASKTQLEFFLHLDDAQARFQEVLDTWDDLGERVGGGSDIADAHYRLIRAFADRQSVEALQKMHGILESDGVVTCRDAIAFSAQQMILQGATGDEQERCAALMQFASIGLVNFSAAVADSLASRDRTFRGTPLRQAPSADMPALTRDQRIVLEQALGLGFTEGDMRQPILVPEVAV